MLHKKILLSVLSLLLVVAATTFAIADKPTNLTDKVKKSNAGYASWFVYTGPQMVWSFNDYLNPNNYTYMASQNPYLECEYGTDALCAVLTERYWNGFVWKPDFSDQSYASAYWGLYQLFYYGSAPTAALHFKNL